jgi:hypothetical protein
LSLICLQRLRKPTGNLGQSNRCSGRNTLWNLDKEEVCVESDVVVAALIVVIAVSIVVAVVAVVHICCSCGYPCYFVVTLFTYYYLYHLKMISYY